LAAQSDASSSETRWLALGLDAVAVKGEAAAHEMTPAQAAEMVGHHLRNVAAPSRLMVSKTPLAQRLDRWVYGMAQPQALPAEDASLAGDGEDQSVVERVQAIWEAVLKVDQVHPNDDFFELGGDSILAIPLFHRLTQAFGVALPIATLFQASTPSALAEKYQALLPQIEALTAHAVAPGGQEVPGVKPNAVMGTALSAADNQQASPFSDQLVIKMKDGDEGKPPIFFTHPGGGSVVFYHAILGHMSHGHPMYGIESPLLSQKRLDLTGMETVEKVAAGYTSLIRNVQPSGPYILAGYSFGGLVSLEMARILQDAGETVRLLIFDTPNPCAEFHRNKLSERLSYHWQKEGAVSEKLLSMSKRATFGVVNRIQNTMSRASARRLNAEERPSKSARILNFQILELYDILTEAYQPQPFQGDMNLFSAEDGGDKVVYDEHLGWRDLIRGDLRVTSVPGSHLTLFADENLPGFVSAVEQCLKSTEMVLHR
jgi:thioesterase domain-containing protein/acyl carrier protein